MEQKSSQSDVSRAFTRHWHFLSSDPLALVSTHASSFFLPRVDHRMQPRQPPLMSALGLYSLLLTSADPKKKKKKVILFSFVCIFICNIQEKKKKRERERKLALTSKKEKKNSNFKFWIPKFKKKKNVGYTFFYSIFMSRDRAKPLSHWAEISSQDHFKIRASELRSKPLSHDPTKPSRDLLQAKIQATKPLSRDPSHRAEIRAKPSWAKIFELFFCKQTQRFH